MEIFELTDPNLAYLLKSELMKIIKKKSQVHVVIIIYFQFSEPLTTIIALKVFHRVGNIDMIFIIIAFLVRKVPEAFTMDPKAFEEEYNVKKPDKNDANIVFHCLAGIRSRAAMEAVHQIGYTK